MKVVRLSQKGIIAQVLILLLLAAGIGASVYLAKHPQILRPLAGGGAIYFRSTEGKALPNNSDYIPQTTSPTFEVELNSTLGAPVFATPTPTSTSPSSSNSLLIKIDSVNPSQINNWTTNSSVMFKVYGSGFSYSSSPYGTSGITRKLIIRDSSGKTYGIGPKKVDDSYVETDPFSSLQIPVSGQVVIYFQVQQGLSNGATVVLAKSNEYSMTFQVPPAPSPTPLAYRRVFVTDATFNANLGGLSGADQQCTTRAITAGLGGFWKAWLSDSTTSTASRMNQSSVPYKLINGTTIANNWNDLIDGTLANPINVTEKGRVLLVGNVWTGTNRYGEIAPTKGLPEYKCFDWTRTDGLSSAGALQSTDYHWTEGSGGGNCLPTTYRLYCFEQSSPLGMGTTNSVLGVGTTGPVQVSGTAFYKIAENFKDLDTASEVPYTQEHVIFNYTLKKDLSPGVKTIWVEFKDVTGKTARVSAQIELVSPIKISTSCSGADLKVSVSGDIESPADKSLGLWSTLTDEKTNQSIIYEFDANQGPPTTHIAANFPPIGSIAGQGNLPIIGDGRTYTVKVYTASSTTGTPSLSNLVAQNAFSKSCTASSPSPTSTPVSSSSPSPIITAAPSPTSSVGIGTTTPSGGTGGNVGVGTTTPGRSIKVTSPNGGETLRVGDVYRITWDSTPGIDKIFIAYTSQAGNNWIDTSLPNTGFYNWTVNVGNTTNTQFKIEISGYDSVGSVTDQSDNFFIVNPAPAGGTGGNVGIGNTAPQPTPTIAPTSTPTSTAPVTPVGGGGGGGGGGSSGGGNNPPQTPVPTPRSIKYVRYAENPTDLGDASWQSYYQGIVLSHIFTDSSPGIKSIFVQFADDKRDIVTINGQNYITSSISLEEEQVAPSATPNVPTAPAPNTPTTPLVNDGPNCPIENPSNYDIGTLYTMCSVNQLARFDLKYLVDFPNEILIDIGRRKGNLGEFLANFSGERLLGLSPYSGAGFSLDILKELPDWRKQQLPGYIQDQLR